MSVREAFNGKTVLVTGAASGIGFQIAQQCAAAGANVLMTDVVDSINEVAAGIDGVVESMVVDVSDRDQVKAAVDRMVDKHGRLDYIFNNAGVAIFGEVEEVTLDDWDKIIDVNLKGVAYGVKLAYDQMIEQGSGHIINTASVAGLVPVPLQSHYVATKHAIVGMDKTMRLESRRKGITITTFCPAFINTGMFENNTFRGTLAGTDARTLVPIKPMSADKAVEKLLAGVARKREMVIVPFYGRLGWWLERYAPPLADLQHRLFYGQTVKRARKAKHA